MEHELAQAMCTEYSGRAHRRDAQFIIDVGMMRTGFLKELVINGHLHNTQEIRLALDGA